MANERAALARLASSFLFIGVENGDFSEIAAAIVAFEEHTHTQSVSKNIITFTNLTSYQYAYQMVLYQ